MSANPLRKVLRSGEGKKLKALEALVPDISELEDDMKALSDAELKAKTGDLNKEWSVVKE